MYDFIYSLNRILNIVFTLKLSLQMYILMTPRHENISENAKHVQLEVGIVRKSQNQKLNVAGS